MSERKPVYLWLDLETTGLNPVENGIVEIAAIITDEDFNELARYQAVTHTRKEWTPFCLGLHAGNGLCADLAGLTAISLEDAENQIHDRLIHPYGRVTLAGKSVHFDRGFLHEHMPGLDKCLIHRHLDVSVLRMMWPHHQIPEQTGTLHRAMPDNEHALEIARAYRAVEKL